MMYLISVHRHCSTTIMMLQKVNKETVKLIFIRLIEQFSLFFLEETRLLYMINTLNLGFYSHIIDQQT